MHVRWIALVCGIVLASRFPTSASEPIDLRVLYAGHPGSDREKDFRSFLQEHVQYVATTDYRTFSANQARDFDVIVFDWTSIYPRDRDGRLVRSDGGVDIPAPPKLSSDFDRPSILIGQAGGSVAEALRLKALGLCLCLEDVAHDVVSSHEVFQQPFHVDLRHDDRPVPAEYLPEERSKTGVGLLLAGLILIVASLVPLFVRFMLSGPGAIDSRRRAGPRNLLTVGLQIILMAGFITTVWGIVVARREFDTSGETMKVWKFQTKSFPAIDPGLVYDPYGFEDSPDAEFIASGLNSKDPHAIALARQGNFFLWGFSASPSDMTLEARKLFLNVTSYIRKFDRHKPIVHREQWARQWALVYARRLERSGYVEAIASFRFPTVLREQFGRDAAKYVAYYQGNLEYLHPVGVGFLVDEDVEQLGLSNRKVELLDTCVAMLEQADRTDLALRILRRYTMGDFADAEGWRSWLDANRDRLFFTDVGGFKFMVAAELRSAPAIPDASKVIEEALGEPDNGRPVVARARLSHSKVGGASLDLVVQVKVAPTWFIHTAEGSRGPRIPTTFELRLPEGIEVEGDWIYPDPTRLPDGQAIYEGAIEFRRRLRINAGADCRLLKVRCELGYQVCDPFSCRPPTKLRLEAECEVSGIRRSKIN